MPYVRSQGLRIHYHVEGDGPPLVLQHGFGDSLASWYELGYVDAFKDEYRLILIDARGHGASEKPHEPEAYGFQNVTADVVAVLDALTVAKAHYFGFSMGGKNGFVLAAYAPERLHSLSVLGAGAAAQAHAPLEFWIASLRQGPEAVPSIWEMDALGRDRKIPLPPALRQRLVSNDIEVLIAQRLQRKAPLGFDEILPTLPIPCLLIVGEADAAYASVKACSRVIPNATFVSFQPWPHWQLSEPCRGGVAHTAVLTWPGRRLRRKCCGDHGSLWEDTWRSALCYSFPVRTSRVHSQQMCTAMHVECLCLTTSYSVCGRKSVLLIM
jgi:pimeloyl-ACP methyl ester carboxylesterase